MKDNTVYRTIEYTLGKCEMVRLGNVEVLLSTEELPLTATLVIYDTNWKIKEHTVQYDSWFRKNVNIYVLEKAHV